jgi:hypothetical protein
MKLIHNDYYYVTIPSHTIMLHTLSIQVTEAPLAVSAPQQRHHFRTHPVWDAFGQVLRVLVVKSVRADGYLLDVESKNSI